MFDYKDRLEFEVLNIFLHHYFNDKLLDNIKPLIGGIIYAMQINSQSVIDFGTGLHCRYFVHH